MTRRRKGYISEVVRGEDHIMNTNQLVVWQDLRELRSIISHGVSYLRLLRRLALGYSPDTLQGWIARIEKPELGRCKDKDEPLIWLLRQVGATRLV